jgi:hypothetical protein
MRNKPIQRDEVRSSPTKLSTMLQGLENCRDVTAEKSETTFALIGPPFDLKK